METDRTDWLKWAIFVSVSWESRLPENRQTALPSRTVRIGRLRKVHMTFTDFDRARDRECTALERRKRRTNS